FWTKVLFDAGLVPVKEPFAKLVNQGMVQGPTPYRKPREGERLAVGEEGIRISPEEAAALPADEVFYKNEKMSKSKGNVVTPEEAVEKFGADALRVFEMFVAPFEQDVVWTETGAQGAVRFLHRVFKLASDLQASYEPDWSGKIVQDDLSQAGRDLRRTTHQTIRKVTDDLARTAFNTSVSELMKMVNAMNDFLIAERNPADDLAASEALESLVLMLSPVAPHSADEIWNGLGRIGFTFDADWPSFDPLLAKEDVLTIAVQVNGKLRDTISVPADAPKDAVEQAALASPRVAAHTEGKTIRKVIFVPGKLVNVVAS
ncbi:MAG: class I tRNA ligase family protein, partial [Nitrospirae bacterium]|nr:class I tRNA ligase family protein [Fimbriimonadaceae bacterium]